VAHVIARVLRLLALAALQLLALAPAHANDHEVERRVKAAYLFRFAAYVQWPHTAAHPEAPLTIGVWGNDELAEDLAALVKTRTIDSRRVEVRRVRETETLAGLHMLFVSHTRAARLAEGLAALHPPTTLVVTESPGALNRGSAINFLIEDGQVRFEVSQEAAERRGLKLSSRLLAVASTGRSR
jgi:hypothetical protein